jgi:hypothetical protein
MSDKPTLNSKKAERNARIEKQKQNERNHAERMKTKEPTLNQKYKKYMAAAASAEPESSSEEEENVPMFSRDFVRTLRLEPQPIDNGDPVPAAEQQRDYNQNRYEAENNRRINEDNQRINDNNQRINDDNQRMNAMMEDDNGEFNMPEGIKYLTKKGKGNNRKKSTKKRTTKKRTTKRRNRRYKNKSNKRI